MSQAKKEKKINKKKVITTMVQKKFFSPHLEKIIQFIMLFVIRQLVFRFREALCSITSPNYGLNSLKLLFIH